MEAQHVLEGGSCQAGLLSGTSKLARQNHLQKTGNNDLNLLYSHAQFYSLYEKVKFVNAMLAVKGKLSICVCRFLLYEKQAPVLVFLVNAKT